MKTCFNRKDIKPKLIFIGDSTARQVFWGTVRKIDNFERESEIIDYSSYTNKKHTSFDFTFDSVDVHFFWDPFLNSSGLNKLVTLSDDHKIRPEEIGLVYTSIGLWFSRWYESEEMENEFSQAAQRLLSLYNKLDWINTSSNKLFIAPILYPSKSLLNDDRKSTIKIDELIVLNQMLKASIAKYSSSISMPVVFNSFSKRHMDSTGYDSTGLHFSDLLCEKQAELLFNTRCNVVTHPNTQYCGSSTKFLKSWFFRGSLATVLTGFALQLYNHKIAPVTVGFTFLVLYLIANGPFVGRTLGSGFGLLACEISVILGFVIFSYTSVKDQHFSLNFIQNRPSLIFRGAFVILNLLSMTLLKNSIVSYTLCNVLVARAIIANTSQYFNHKAESQFTISKVVKSLICDYGVVIIISVIMSFRFDQSFLFMVFETPTECFLLLGLYSVTAWIASILSQKLETKETNFKSLAILFLGVKIFTVLVTRVLFTGIFKWSGFEFLDVVALKFGLTLHISSKKNLLKFLTLSGLAFVCTLLLLNSTLKNDSGVMMISNITKGIFISSSVAYLEVNTSPPISSLTFPWLEKILVFLGRMDFVILSLATSVFFKENYTIPVILSPTTFGFFGHYLNPIIKAINGLAVGAILLFTSATITKLTAGKIFSIYSTKSHGIFEFEENNLQLLS